MKALLVTTLDQHTLRRMAGRRSFGRGEAYFASGRVRALAGREKDHPDDALLVYQGQIDPIVNRKNNEAYHEALDLLRKIRELMMKLGREEEFARYLETVRSAHKPKRNFMKLIDQIG